MTQRQRSSSPLPDVSGLTIGILGGTGDQGRGLARRFVLAGHQVIIGSRNAERARQAAESLGQGLPPGAAGRSQGGGTSGAAGRSQGGGTSGAVGRSQGGGTLRGAENPVAAIEADIVIIAVPWDGHKATLESLRAELAGKIVIDCVNPLGFDGQGAYPLPVEEGSAAQQAAAVLPDSTVVAAFHHVSAVLLLDPEIAEIELDVLVLGDDRKATELVQALAGRLPGVRGVYGGRLRNACQVEALTANLIAVNRRYKAHAGLRITDLD